MRKKAKKFIAFICIASILATSYPLVSTPITVHAEPVSISMGLFEQVFGSLAGSFGIKSRSNSKYYGFPSIEELWNAFKQTYEMTRATKPEMLALTVDAWACSNLKDFISGAIKVFPFFVQDYKDGTFDGVMGELPTVENFKTLFNSDKKILYDSSYDGLQYRCYIRDTNGCASQENYIEGISNERSLECFNSIYGVNSKYYIWGTHSGGVVSFYPIVPGTHSFVYISSTSVSFFNDTNEIYYSDYPGKPESISFTLKSFEYKYDFRRFRFDNFYTNMPIRVFEDGSALIYDPSILESDSVGTIEGSVWDEMQKSGSNIDDWELADENGKTIDDPESKILEKIYKNMLTADDIKALQNGDTSVLDKLQGMTAVNSKTGETVGDIKDEVQDQTGILGGIKAIGRTIASRVLTIVNLIRNLHDRKWTSVIDNVGDITLPIIGSIESLQGIARAIQASKWVIDNVGDITKPLTTALDNVGDLVMQKIKTVSTAIDNVNANIATVISGCQTQVINGVKSLSDTATNILDGVKSIPKAISTAFVDAFVPSSSDMDLIHTRMNTLCVEHFGITGKELSISIPEKKFTSVYFKNKKIVDADVLNSGVDKIRPIVQALMWFFMLLFAINQVLELFDKKGVADGNDS